MNEIIIIAAIDKRKAIGFQNKLLYWLPNDLKRFKTLTTGNTLVMGRKTFESLPNGALPNRRNIVISSNRDLSYANAEIFSNLEEAIGSCQDEKVFIIGGESIYKQAIDWADRLCMTEIHAEAEDADAYFPTIKPEYWKEESRDDHPADDKHPCSYSFVNYVRRD